MVQGPPGDLLMGAKAIADYLGIKPRQVYHMAENERLPHFAEGRTICARRSTLTTWLAEREKSGAPQEVGDDADG